ncbi:MAG: MarR family transcriptional regulator [Methanobrevibacter sp.]|uniref:MarR family transcriptional regulator n=1 Tax=Methanobrevibacter millerae TaxID=230361 RepID=A0A8T3VLU7_9EURY|nr:MarR family transcriptional regulator [Methanobrevibacter sp.]MBE6510890.1 MarR family transcriptional regulator [Methanobrevibacter millerae]MBO5151114.1 MarR family transcriptional regulator [Methanobrevibacter sp.]
MSYCDLEKVDVNEMPVGKLIAILARAQATYFNHMLSEIGINDPQLHILFEINKDSKINQDKIASRCNTNKGAVARSIKKLEENGLVTRTIDENNRRQNIITLTQKGSQTLDKAIGMLDELESYLFEDDNEKQALQIILRDLSIKVMKLNDDRFGKK